MYEQLINKINNKDAVLAVIGMGYVGLPLAVEMAQAGFQVTGIDVEPEKVSLLNKGSSYIQDVPTELLSSLVEDGYIQGSLDFSVLRTADAVSICVPTPLRKTKDPDISFIISAADEVKKYLHPGQLIILESTTYPGTTDEILRPQLEETGLTVGKDFFLCFSPERVDPGNAVYTTKNTPKIIGGITEKCSEAAKSLYSFFIENVITVSSTKAAEMVKLLENTFRSVNIGLVNELALMCDRLGINVWEVIDAAATKPFGFMPFYPGPGLGGHCIPIDPVFLSWKLKTLNYTARFIELASEINANMPLYVVDLITQALNGHKKSVNGSQLLLLGMSYKKDIDDTRESPAIDIFRLLQKMGASVSYVDPMVQKIEIDGMWYTSKNLTPQILADCDCVVIATNHSCFDYEMIVDEAVMIVDTRNATREFPNRKNIIKL